MPRTFLEFPRESPDEAEWSFWRAVRRWSSREREYSEACRLPSWNDANRSPRTWACKEHCPECWRSDLCPGRDRERCSRTRNRAILTFQWWPERRDRWEVYSDWSDVRWRDRKGRPLDKHRSDRVRNPADRHARCDAFVLKEDLRFASALRFTSNGNSLIFDQVAAIMMIRSEQAQVDFRRVLRIEGEIHSVSIVIGAQGKGIARIGDERRILPVQLMRTRHDDLKAQDAMTSFLSSSPRECDDLLLANTEQHLASSFLSLSLSLVEQRGNHLFEWIVFVVFSALIISAETRCTVSTKCLTRSVLASG